MGSMWRNREVRRFLGAMVLAGVPAVLVIFRMDRAAGWVSAVLLAILLLFSGLFTRRRYRRIAALSDQLAKIAGGDYRIDIGEYAEGELSILTSEIHKITSTLSHQARTLRRDKAFLSDSLADISHQLKTPLTSMSMLADLLEMPNLPEDKRREFLQGLRVSLDRTQWLIAALLKLSRLDAGAVMFQIREEALGEVLREAVASLRIPAELKGQTLTLQVREELRLCTDRHWLEEAVGNLVKNCVEHTQEGGEIEVRCVKNALYTEIRIADNGPGIPKEDLPHIFERFYRGKNAAADSVGIGLALCKSIVQNLGGTLAAGNRPGGGVEFVIKLYGKTVV